MTRAARICLGQIGTAHGVGGEVRLRSFTADPAAIADYGPLETEDGRAFEIESLRPVKDHFIARLSGVSDRNAASALANTKLYVPRERLPEPDEADEFYHADLIGLAVVDSAGKHLGTIVALHNFGAGDLIEVKPRAGGKTELLPFDQATVPVVDIAGGRVVVNPFLPPAEERGEAKPSRVSDQAGKHAEAQTRTRTAAGSRRHPAPSRKRRG